MAGPSTMLSASATPTQKSYVPQQQQQQQQPPPQQPSSNAAPSRPSFDGLQPPAPNGGRNLSASAVSFASRGPSLNPSPMPGSFSSELRSQMNLSRAGSRPDMFPVLDKLDEDDGPTHEKTLAILREALSREMKIKEGSENMLEALNSKKAKQTKDQRQRVEAELHSSNLRIKDLRQKLADAQRVRAAAPTTPTRARTEGLLSGTNGLRSPPSASRSGAGSDVDEPTESPTFALTEILQALEVAGMTPDYYVSRANSLVDLFKRHPTLKYDLVWSIFGLRMQDMLLSESREVVAAAYRMVRYAISDINSLRNIRALNTDYLVTWSLVKDRKADVEREQALKFVRAFLDVKDGVREVSRAVVRSIAAAAAEPEERLRPVCLETLAEILVRDPQLLIASGGMAPLREALADGSYKASESLTSAFLYLLDAPERRQYLRPGNEIEVIFTAFTDELSSNEQTLKQSVKSVAWALRSWSGLMSLAMYDFRAIRSMITSMVVQAGPIRETIMDLIFSLLRIKPPAWATSFLAGRRLTTYGRVANLKSTTTKPPSSEFEEDGGEQNFLEHYTALLLAVFIKSGVVPALLKLTQDNESATLKRKSTLLIGEVLRLSSRLLPPSFSSQLQMLPELFISAARLSDERHFSATGVVYQISSVSKTLYRSSPSAYLPSSAHHNMDLGALDEHPKSNTAMNFDDATFRQLLLDSNVLSSSNYTKWNWDVILRLIEGPLTSGKRLEEAIKASKFIKRIMSFYRPFKFKFSEIKSSRNTQKYVRTGCSLMHALLQSPEGVKYLSDNKMLRQIAECLAQCDPTSGLTAQDPMFSKDRLADTLCGGYFPMLGVLSGDPKGMQMLDRWRIFNMVYRILDLKQRPDLIKLMLANFDYSLQGHPRVLLSKALTAGTKDIRIYATNALRKYATHPRLGPHGQEPTDSKWAIQLLVTQLYDPEVEVCATAVKILEKACNTKNHLEYIVECRPALDHLGEIGAPLLLRFLSTSIGYHYLDGLDYISNEMDDWFLGRNDSYVGVIEASLARSFFLLDPHHSHHHHHQHIHHPDDRVVGDDEHDHDLLMMLDDEADSHVPPHFYRELTRTQEGCKLLRDKGHFDEFAATIREHGMQSEDAEMLVKVKGCLWAVGNVGSMELGAPFLEASDVVEQIVRIAQAHEVLSLRGTAFFVLGLISRSIHGLEILSENGWDANTNLLGHSLGLCVPGNLGQLFSLQPWRHVPATAIELPDSQKTETAKLPAMPSRPRSESLLKALQEAEQVQQQQQQQGQGQQSQQQQSQGVVGDGSGAAPPRVELDPDPTNQRVLELVIDMSNTVLYRRARAELVQLRARQQVQQQQQRKGSTAGQGVGVGMGMGMGMGTGGVGVSVRGGGGSAGGGGYAFAQPALFRKVSSLLECRHYRLADRNMIVGLFERSVQRAVVYGEDESAEEEDEDDDEDEVEEKRSGKDESEDDDEEDGESEEEDEGRQREQRGVERQGERGVGQGGVAVRGGRAESESEEEEEDDEEDEEEEEEEDDEDEDEDGESSGDEQRTERQRSVSDPADIKRRGFVSTAFAR